MPFQVPVLESERGWGQKIDFYAYFETIDAADAYVKDFNKDNTANTAPDWYMMALEPRFIREIPRDSKLHGPIQTELKL